MDTLAYITWQMARDSNALGFIPKTTLKSRYLARNLYLLQRNSLGEKIGYLLHGPPKAGQALYVHQCVIRLDHRRRLHATRLVCSLIARARLNGVDALHLRCALTLEASFFWPTLGFRLHHVENGGPGRNRKIGVYTLDLATRPFPTAVLTSHALA